MSSLAFIYRKISTLGVSAIVRSELEAWMLGLADLIPGFAGIFLRYPVYKLLFRRLGGLPIIQRRVTIVHTRRLTVGKHFGVNSGTYINALGDITIGDYVLIGSNVTISSGKHEIDGVEPPIFARPSTPLPIHIEDDVWIGAGAVIMPGVTLAKGSVIGAGAIVTKSTVPYGVFAGAPARLIRMRAPGLDSPAVSP